MKEEIEYAEMLEIPVSTVNVVHKKRAKKKKTTESAPVQTPPIVDLKNSVIQQVNEQVENQNTDEQTERIDTVRVYSKEDKDFFDEHFATPHDYDFPVEETENDDTRYEMNSFSRSEKRTKLVLGIEFALSCALCGAIFLTNVFMPGSAINTFFKALTDTAQTSADERVYTDFTLSSVLSAYSSAQLQLSPTGILTFTDKCCVYPAADGKVSEVTQNEDGSFTLKIAHSDSFSGVMTGLSSVFYQVGDTVKANVPVAYSNGEAEVQVMMYSSGELLNCFELTEENCLVWLQQE